jgi:hypothetical protein
MNLKLSLVALALFFVPPIGSAQHSPPADNCPNEFREIYSAVKAILFSLPNDDAAAVTLYVEPSWAGLESQVTIQFPESDTPTVTSFRLAPEQKPISSIVRSAIKDGRCDARTIASGIKVIRNRVLVNDHLRGLIDRLWSLDIIPRPIRSIHLDATLYVLQVHGQDNIRVATDDYDSPVVKWMEEILAAVNDR